MTQPALQNEIFAQPLPDFLPERIRAACSGKRVQFRIPGSVRERMQVPEDIDGAEWADKYHRVTAIDAHPGPWRSELVPHTVKALKFASSAHVRQLWLCWPERAAKTQVLTISAKRVVDRGIESGNIFWLMPNEHEAKKAIGERVIPSLQASRRTARLLSRYADDTTRTIIRFKHGPRLFAAWAGSAASVSSFFGRLCIGDEIDKAEVTGVGKETDILTLLFKRGRDSDSSQFLFASTPAQGYIYTGTTGCQQVWEYRVKCPHCGDVVGLSSDNITYPEGASAEDAAHGQVSLTIAPPCCGTVWSEYDRRVAYVTGDWVCTKGQNITYPETVGMHMTAYVLPNIPLTEIAEKIIKAKTGGSTEKKALVNGYDCEDYIPEAAGKLAYDHILALRDDRPEGLVPSVPIAAITCTADMQKRGFWYKVTAWGYGLEQESWLLEEGFLDNWESLRKKMFESVYEDVNKVKYSVTLRGMDSGGGEGEEHADLSRTAEAYMFASANPGVVLFKGRRRMARNFTVSDIDRIPGTNKPLPGSAKLYTINTTFFKDKLSGKLMVSADDPGAWHLHKDVSEDFAKQMVAEFKNDQGYWECPKGKDNHMFDCSQMELALVELAQVKYWPSPDQAPTDPPAEAQKQNHEVNSNNRRRW